MPNLWRHRWRDVLVRASRDGGEIRTYAVSRTEENLLTVVDSDIPADGSSHEGLYERIQNDIVEYSARMPHEDLEGLGN